jgi:hypothetical protein
MRTSLRRQIDVQAYIRESGATAVAGTVKDLSTDDCRVLSAAVLATGSMVWLKIKGLGARQARVAWARHGEYGCRFLSSIECALVEELSSAYLKRGSSRLWQDKATTIGHDLRTAPTADNTRIRT